MPGTEEFPIKFQFAISEDLDAVIDEWRRQQPKPPNRSEAIRRLVELGLGHSQPRRAGAHKGASKANELAAKEIDRAGDASATTEQRQSRKRRILNGPAEFRELRKDLPGKPPRGARGRAVRAS